MSNNPIVLKSNRLSDECIVTVRLTPEAEKVVRRLRAKTALPIRQIVSEIIVQAENLIDIEGPSSFMGNPALCWSTARLAPCW